MERFVYTYDLFAFACTCTCLPASLVAYTSDICFALMIIAIMAQSFLIAGDALMLGTVQVLGMLPSLVRVAMGVGLVGTWNLEHYSR